MPSPANLSAARAKAASWALQYGQQEPRWNKDHTDPTGQIGRQMDFAATDASKGKRGKDIAILQHHNCTLLV